MNSATNFKKEYLYSFQKQINYENLFSKTFLKISFIQLVNLAKNTTT